MNMKPLLIGPIPPPTDGRAVATRWLVNALAAQGCATDVIDTQLPPGRLRVLRKALRCAQGTLRVLATRRPMILVASAGAGLLMELLPLLGARVVRSDTFLVHHSSKYARSSWAPMRAAVTVGGSRMQHVFLCEPMRATFSTTYGIAPNRSMILDNAALIPPLYDKSQSRRREIVHIANLSRRKERWQRCRWRPA